MRLTAENKAMLRSKVLDGAARALRRDGYAVANLDRIMAEADLTRGAFYAHFSSKDAVFEAVLAERHPLLDRLKARDGVKASALRDEMLQIFGDYLTPGNLDAVFMGCTVASLAGDAARREAVRPGFEAGRNAILEEMARGQKAVDTQVLSAALSLANGALTTARAMATAEAAADVLTSANAAFGVLIATAIPNQTQERAT